MGVKLVTAPLNEPITLAEAKAHLRVVDSEDDTLITALIKSARQNVENWLGRALVDQTWDYYLDAFPTNSKSLGIQIPKPPLIEIVSVKYDDLAGVQQSMDPADYYVDNVSEPGWIVPVGTGASWPTPIDAINSVVVRFRAGYVTNDSPADTAIPFDVRAGIMLTIGSLYEHRELQVVGSIASRLPFGVEQLLRYHRVLLGMA